MNNDYSELEKKLKYKSDMILKKTKMRDFLISEGFEQLLNEKEYEYGHVIYMEYTLCDRDCLIIYELQPNNINIAKIICLQKIENVINVIRFLNILNCNEMHCKYTLNKNNHIEVSVNYATFADDFKPAMLHEFMKICVGSIESNLEHIILNEN